MHKLFIGLDFQVVTVMKRVVMTIALVQSLGQGHRPNLIDHTLHAHQSIISIWVRLIMLFTYRPKYHFQ